MSTVLNQKRTGQFPRKSDLPSQSPKYWVKEKDRYIRQLLICDIEEITARPLVVFFSQLDQQIGHTDPDDISEILSGLPSGSIDILIQTPGGDVDATEKLISILRHRTSSYRIIVPSWAKSAGTVLALSSSEIVLGVNSELGPIDPQFQSQHGPIPCEIIASDPNQPPHVKALATLAVQRMRALAKSLLTKGMMRERQESEIDDVLAKLSSSTGYQSHGAVIDYDEAIALGLTASYIDPEDELWKRIWLLYCMYDYDTKAKNLAKIFEGSRYSLSRSRI